jgi:hypothetical protein
LRFRNVLAVSGVLTLVSPPRAAEACGPFFPPALLADRPATLGELPDGSFADSVGRLVPRPEEAFVVQEGAEPEGARTGGGARETALYGTGAKAFQEGRPGEARESFEAVLALPEGERQRFSTYAAYMLGRLAESPEEARKRFGEVRALARGGFADPAGLAVASLGEEARLLLQAGDDAGAVRLYVQQAAHGSSTGVTSLLFVSRALAADDARREKALADPLVQRLLSLYAWTHRDDSWEVDGTWRSVGKELLEALAARPSLAGADTLAAAAWRSGRFDLAERFAPKEQTPLATWVQSKLALRGGDTARAATLLAAVAAAAGKDGAPVIFGDVSTVERLEGEQAVLALGRDDFGDAMSHALRSCVWRDIAYLAERVLTVEELERLVQARASQPPARCGASETPEVEEWQGWGPADVDGGLRSLLARRLLRGGRGQDALPHFAPGPVRALAEGYQRALDRAARMREPVERAAALHDAALIAREHGLQLLGTEDAPDWAWTDGMYSLGDGLEAEPAAGQAVVAAPRAVGPGERARLKASAPPHAVRFHYRSTAADLEEQAAALLPPRSQAYAALLCHAGRFVRHTEPERFTRLWQQYVQRGAFLREPWEFGVQCPEPAFARAGAMLQAERGRLWRKRLLVAAPVSMLLGALGYLTWRRRRSRASAPARP